MKQKKGTLLVIALALLSGSGLIAQESEAEQETVRDRVWTDRVVVTASRLEQEERDVTANVTVLDEEDVRHSAALTVDDFLRTVPGFSLFRRASSLVVHPTAQGVSLRGIGPSGVSRTLVLLDGVPLNDPFGGWVYWSSVPLEFVDTVEIVRGGSSNVWGNAALGGVIQLMTEDVGEDSFGLTVEGGNKGTARADVSFGERWEGSSLRLFGNYFDTDGYYVLRENQRGAIDIPALSEHWTLGASADFDLSPSARLTIAARAFDEERGNGTPLTNNATDFVAASARLVTVADSGTEWNASLFYRDQDFSSTFSSQAGDRSSESPALDQFSTPSEAIGGSAQWLRPFERSSTSHLLSIGADLRSTEGVTNEDGRNLGAGFLRRRRAGGDEDLAGLYIQDSVSVGDSWQVQLGARIDRWESSNGFRQDTDLADGSVTLTEFADSRETQVSPKISAVYRASSVANVRASVYRAFRAPSINELYRPFRVGNDITEANALLVPETLDGIEVGVDLRGARARGNVTLFYNQGQDPIANVTLALGPGVIAPCGFVPGGGSCRQRQNLDESEVKGLEADVRYRAGRRWDLRASYLLTDAKITRADQSPDLEGKTLAQVPDQQLVLGAIWANPSIIDVSLQGRFVDEQFEDDQNARLLDSFVVFDVALSRQINETWGAFLRMENVFDEEVEIGMSSAGLVNIGAPMLVHGGIRLRLNR